MSQRFAVILVAAATLIGVVACGSGGKHTAPRIVVRVSSRAELVTHGTRSSRARLNTFARYWWGHGRGLDIHRSGRGREFARTYNSRPPYYVTLTFRVIRVSGSRTAAGARIRIISVRAWNHYLPHARRIRVGALGTLRLRRGVVTDSLTQATYCAPNIGRCGL